MQYPVNQRVNQKFDQRLAKSHLPRQYLDIALVRGQYLDIALEAGQYKIYCPAKAFDLPTQSVTSSVKPKENEGISAIEW